MWSTVGVVGWSADEPRAVGVVYCRGCSFAQSVSPMSVVVIQEKGYSL